jgi:hypothetical protein
MRSTAHTNRLIHETSPYLLQHAHNPVDWYPWGAEALDKARRENKPILLSIGYSACHWCHVMEHESFEDEETARVMNELFVCIKLDREERPDLDKIYQTAHQVLAQRPGGWPLNMFLTPDDHMPFFGGTYFPKTPRYGMPGFVQLLREIAAVYRDKHEAVRQQNEQLADVFRRLAPAPPAPGEQPSAAVLEQAYAELRDQFDATYGGFGGAPKFPHPTSLEVLLHHHARGAAPADGAGEMALLSLTRMAAGGLYDHVGGGFCRYAVDARWEIPHFEKMLYDNAQLLPLYADAYRLSGQAHYRRTALETGEWVMREMQAPAGGYYATLDADSEGHEGRYYVWSLEELRRLLDAQEWAAVELRFGLTGEPNFEGQWHLNVRSELPAVARRLGIDEAETAQRLERARAKLFEARARRVRPARDEKILASWNGLMIKGMAHAGRVLGREDFVASAARAFDFVRSELWREGRLLATCKDGRARLPAYLDDHAFLIAAALELLQARWHAPDLAFARELAHVMIEHFEDESLGGFFFTADDHERLVYRPKPTTDEALPAGNGVAARALLQLGALLGDLNLLHAAERSIEAFYSTIRRHPSAHGALLLALEELWQPGEVVVLRGSGAAVAPWLARAQRDYAPRRLLLAIPPEAADVPAELAARAARATVTAYICRGRSCSAPITAPAEFDAALAAPDAST